MHIAIVEKRKNVSKPKSIPSSEESTKSSG